MKREQRHGLWQQPPNALLGGLGLALLTVVCYRLHVNPTTVALLYLIVVVLVSSGDSSFRRRSSPSWPRTDDGGMHDN